jgi:Tat protein translocase TatB subunit
MEIFGIGLPEILLIMVVALVVLGPERLPEAARTLGKGIADLRRTVEPARSAWRDLTGELNNVTTEVTGAVRSTANAATSVLKPAHKGEVTTAIPSDNPWTVHPIMEGMTPGEKEKFMATGEIPPHIQEELAQRQASPGNGRAYFPEVVDLDYPMPHTELSYQPAPPFAQEPEELDYPTPGNSVSPPIPREEKNTDE